MSTATRRSMTISTITFLAVAIGLMTYGIISGQFAFTMTGPALAVAGITSVISVAKKSRRASVEGDERP